MKVERALAAKARAMAARFPVVSVTGPRQSGKSTLVQAVFPEYRYVTLEDEDTRAFARDDPRSFLALYDNRVILDEAQRAPSLFSYLQGVVDRRGEAGQYILSGSQNFLLMDSIAQSLAGRVAVLNLLPFSWTELSRAGLPPPSINDWLLTGGYPRIYDAGIEPADFYPGYVQTYLERDVRRGAGIAKLAEFRRFLALCAERNACLLNREELARDCGVAVKTADNWLSVLEASFVVFRLQPFYRNLGKRLVKTPKLYFADTGLACHLLGLETPEDLAVTPYRGPLFEAAAVGEVLKAYHAAGKQPRLSFWRDAAKNEVDLVIEKGASVAGIAEIKSTATYAPKLFKMVTELGELLGLPKERRFVVYAGESSFETSLGRVLTLGDAAGLAAL